MSGRLKHSQCHHQSLIVITHEAYHFSCSRECGILRDFLREGWQSLGEIQINRAEPLKFTNKVVTPVTPPPTAENILKLINKNGIPTEYLHSQSGCAVYTQYPKNVAFPETIPLPLYQIMSDPPVISKNTVASHISPDDTVFQNKTRILHPRRNAFPQFLLQTLTLAKA